MKNSNGKIPEALISKVKRFENMVNFNIIEKLEKICKDMYISDKISPQAFDYVCPICESYMFYIYYINPGKNKPFTTECLNCKSNSSKRTLDCAKMELLFSLKHNK